MESKDDKESQNSKNRVQFQQFKTVQRMFVYEDEFDDVEIVCKVEYQNVVNNDAYEGSVRSDKQTPCEDSPKSILKVSTCVKYA